MFASFGLPELAQVNVATDLARFQEMYKYIDAVTEEEALHPEWGYSEHLLKITYDRFPYRMEDPLKMYERGLQLRRFLHQYMKSRPIIGQ
jgi:hypothetical protein